MGLAQLGHKQSYKKYDISLNRLLKVHDFVGPAAGAKCHPTHPVSTGWSLQAGFYKLVVARAVEAMEARRACSKGFGPFKDGLRMAGPHADGPCLLG